MVFPGKLVQQTFCFRSPLTICIFQADRATEDCAQWKKNLIVEDDPNVLQAMSRASPRPPLRHFFCVGCDLLHG